MQNRSSRWRPWLLHVFWISDRNDFSCFNLQVAPTLPTCTLYQVSRGHPGAFREGEVLRQFQDFGEKLWSKLWISLYIFTSPTFSPKQPSRMTPEFQVSWPFSSGEEVQNRFSRLISDQKDFSFFDLQVT